VSQSTAIVSKADVQRAKIELDRMKGSLRKWLKYRTLNDAVLEGRAPTKKPRAVAEAIIKSSRDITAEGKLARQIHVLLAETMPGIALPDPDVLTNPQAAVQLARIVVDGPPEASPSAQGAWYTSWPVLVVGGLLLAITTVVRTMADAAERREYYACVQSGACADQGQWLKWGGIAALAYVAWQLGLGERVKKALKG
jgi:hypothetical protein